MNIHLAEIRQAWRASLRKPGFLMLAASVLALGIGASVAVFTLIDQVLLAPLPVPDPAHLVVAGPRYGGRVGTVSPRQYQHMLPRHGERAGLVQDGLRVNVAGGGAPELVGAMRADRGFLPALGLAMVLGRNFDADEDRVGGPSAVILGHGFWQRRYGGAPDVIGRSLLVEGRAHRIVGVLPAAFARLGFDGEIVLPAAIPAMSRETGTNYTAVLRLAPGGDVAAIGAAIDTRLKAMYADEGDPQWQRVRFGTQPFADWQRSEAKRMLVLFMASAGFVLLIALVNLASLMLLRTLARAHDAAVRNALGATPARLMLPALAEGALVGLLGALAGVALAVPALALIEGWIPAGWLPGAKLGLGARALGVALAIGLAGALLAALLGLWRGRRAATIDELREGGRSGPGLASGRLGRALVVAQVALATTLLTAAGVFLHTLYDAARAPLGFSGARVLSFELAPVRGDYPDAGAVNALAERIERRLGAIPGITEATAATNLPADLVSGQFNLGPFAEPGSAESYSAQYRGVGPEFFALFSIAMREGRAFGPGDVRGGEKVAIVNQALATRRYGGKALGRLVEHDARGFGGTPWSARIVGVVADTRQFGPLAEAPEILYVPLAQMSERSMELFRDYQPLRFAVRGHGNPEDWRDAVRAAVAEVAPGQPIANLRAMADVVRSTTAGVRLNLLLVGIFGALALTLATAGLYAVMAVAVAAREREFSVRSALGASPASLVRRVLAGGLAQIGIGLALGVVLALGLAALLRAVLADLGRGVVDPAALAAVCLLLALAGSAACLAPAVRAGRVQPMRALRGD